MICAGSQCSSALPPTKRQISNKVWLIDEQRKEGGGIYLFTSRELAEAYAASDIVPDLRRRRPGTEFKVFDDLHEASALTGAAFGQP